MSQKNNNDLLHIEELTFSLPENFSGGLVEALEEVVKYLKSKNVTKEIQPNDDISTIIEVVGKDEKRISVKYGFMKNGGDNKYIFLPVIPSKR